MTSILGKNLVKQITRVAIPHRNYRFGRRVSQQGYYVSPDWFDQKIFEKKTSNESILGTDGMVERKNQLFDEEKKRQRALVTRLEKIEINLEKPFPDGEDYVLMMNRDLSTPYECAAHINEMVRNRSALAVVNQTEHWDMHRPLNEPCHLRLLHFKHPDVMPVNYAFWRSCSMLLAGVVQRAFRQDYPVKIISMPMSDLKGGSFLCDADIEYLTDWRATSQELQSITSLLWEETNDDHHFEWLEVNAEMAGKLFLDNPYRMAYIEQMVEKENCNRFTLYRVGRHIELSPGPMISRTGQIGSIYLTAVHPLKTKTGQRFYRFQGIALPKQLNCNPFAYSLIRDRSKRLNRYGLEQQ